MRKPATAAAVLASPRSSFDGVTATKLALPIIKCKAIRDGHRLAYILRNEATDMESFISLFEATAAQYPFHQPELRKAFCAGVNR